MKPIRPTTRDAIVEAGFQVLNDRPGASLEEIAKAAGVGRATLHRHFSSRDTLMTALAHQALEELNDAVEAATTDATSHSDGLKRALEVIIPLANRQWFLAHEHVERDPSVSAAYRTDLEKLHAAIDAARAEGAFAANVPTAWIAETYESLVYGAWTLVRRGDLTARQAAALAWRTLTQGLGGDQT